MYCTFSIKLHRNAKHSFKQGQYWSTFCRGSLNSGMQMFTVSDHPHFEKYSILPRSLWLWVWPMTRKPRSVVLNSENSKFVPQVSLGAAEMRAWKRIRSGDIWFSSFSVKVMVEEDCYINTAAYSALKSAWQWTVPCAGLVVSLNAPQPRKFVCI